MARPPFGGRVGLITEGRVMASFIDETGQPRSDDDLQEAIGVINTIMVKHPTLLPTLTVYAGVIRDCLLELQYLREKLKEAKAAREAKED